MRIKNDCISEEFLWPASRARRRRAPGLISNVGPHCAPTKTELGESNRPREGRPGAGSLPSLNAFASASSNPAALRQLASVRRWLARVWATREPH